MANDFFLDGSTLCIKRYGHLLNEGKTGTHLVTFFQKDGRQRRRQTSWSERRRPMDETTHKKLQRSPLVDRNRPCIKRFGWSIEKLEKKTRTVGEAGTRLDVFSIKVQLSIADQLNEPYHIILCPTMLFGVANLWGRHAISSTTQGSQNNRRHT
jgi:hypothetical protein